jgi:hypothetical protein
MHGNATELRNQHYSEEVQYFTHNFVPYIRITNHDVPSHYNLPREKIPLRMSHLLLLWYLDKSILSNMKFMNLIRKRKHVNLPLGGNCKGGCVIWVLRPKNTNTVIPKNNEFKSNKLIADRKSYWASSYPSAHIILDFT